MAEPDGDSERSERLRRLEDRLAQHRRSDLPPPRANSTGLGQANLAWRMTVELVTGLMIGFGIGYGLDRLFGTGPIFLVLFVLFGFAAGVNVMLHTAREVGKAAETAADGNEAAETAADGNEAAETAADGNEAAETAADGDEKG